MRDQFYNLSVGLLVFLFSGQITHAAEEETNKNIIKAEAKYNEKMANIISNAQKDADKAKADLMKALERELATATKKGKFDEAMRIKLKLEERKKEDQVGDLFGEVEGGGKTADGGTDKADASDVKITFLSIWTKQGVPPETKEKLKAAMIDEKSNTLKVDLKQITDILGHNDYFNMSFGMGGSTLRVSPSPNPRFWLTDDRQHTLERFYLVLAINSSKSHTLNYEMVAAEVKKLLKEKKE